MKVSAGQIRTLHLLWRAFAERELLGPGDHRELRLKTAGKLIGRKIASFSDLEGSEAGRVIDELKKHLGIAETRKARHRRLRDRDAAHAAGTEGRRGGPSTITMASGQDIARIEDALGRLGWSQEQFAGWLRSEHSPIKRQAAEPKIRTQWEANRVWWALKRMLERAGKWNKEPGTA